MRCIRDLYFSADSRLWTLILLDSTPPPPEVYRLTVPFEVGWPSEEELVEVVRATLREIQHRSLEQIECKLSKRELEMLVQTLRGLTTEEAARVVAAAVHEDNVLDSSDLPRIVDAKRSRLGTTGCLESIAADVSPDEIGGLKNLKRWLNLRRSGFSPRTREFGLDPPQGDLAAGSARLREKPVCEGRRLGLAHAAAADGPGRALSEVHRRERSPAARGAASGRVDGRRLSCGSTRSRRRLPRPAANRRTAAYRSGCSARCSPGCKTTAHPIFLIATANNLAQLPAGTDAERAGSTRSFSSICPGRMNGEAIFSIHLTQAAPRSTARSTWRSLVADSEGFSGAEIEQAIISGLVRGVRGKVDVHHAAHHRRHADHAAAVGGDAASTLPT